MSPKVHVFTEIPENKGIWVHKRDDTQTDYRKNGHAATLGDLSRSNRYKTPKKILATLQKRERGVARWLPLITPYSPAHVERYYFTFVAVPILGKLIGQAIPNFSRGKAPYANQAHHLIPQAQFLALFGTREEEMLKRVDYNVHNGRNIMFLPERPADAAFHGLPYHAGPHGPYDDQVVSDANALGQRLRRLGEDACTEEVLNGIKEELLILQENYWKSLSNAGAVAVRDVQLSPPAG